MGELAAGRPKPMVEIDGEPLLCHLMQAYARFGFRRFILCTGHRGDVISSYFMNYPVASQDFTVDLGNRSISFHQTDRLPDWQVTIAHTGSDSMTGARVARAAARYLDAEETFAVTYGDGLTDADLGAEMIFHLVHRRIGTVLAVNPTSSYGEFRVATNGMSHFMEKPRLDDRWINGGFFFFRRQFLDYLSCDPDCVLEREPLQRLSEQGELALFHHEGFWSSMDTPNDHERMNALCEGGARPWLGAR